MFKSMARRRSSRVLSANSKHSAALAWYCWERVMEAPDASTQAGAGRAGGQHRDRDHPPKSKDSDAGREMTPMFTSEMKIAAAITHATTVLAAMAVILRPKMTRSSVAGAGALVSLGRQQAGEVKLAMFQTYACGAGLYTGIPGECGGIAAPRRQAAPKRR
jgi:putative intracellular protease/amidase